MIKKDELFLLVKSLNKNEKIYFKRSTKKHTQGGGNKYLKLFDVLCEQKVYNEPRILKKFANEKFSKQLHVMKNYLLNAILKSLHDYHYEASSSSSLKNSLRSVEILFHKGLYDTCSKLLAKAKKQVVVYEDETGSLLLEIIEWERKLLIKQIKDKSKIQHALNTLEKEEEDVFKKYTNSRKYRFLRDKIFLIQYTKGGAIDKKSKLLMEQLAKHPLLQTEKNALSFSAQISYNTFYEIFYSLKNDTLSGIKFAKRKVELWEKNPDMWKNNINPYLAALNSLRILLHGQNNYLEVFAVLHKIKQIPEKTIHIKVWKFVHSTMPELSTYSSMGEFGKAANIGIKVGKELKEYENKIDSERLLFIYIQLAYAFFGAEEYKLSLRWVNILLNEKNKGQREDIIHVAKLLNLILHYEMGNYTLLESLIKSTARSFSQSTSPGENKKSQFYFETLFIDSLKKIIQDKNQKHSIVILTETKENILKSARRLSSGTFKGNYDLIVDWLESKIEKKSFAEVVKSKS